MKRIKKIGILSAYDHRNRGDRAIIEAQMAWLSQRLGEVRFVVYSAAWRENSDVFGPDVSCAPPIRVDATRGGMSRIGGPLLSSLHAALRRNPPVGLDRLSDCDAWFLCGGGYLYSSQAPLLSRQLWIHVGNALLACGTGRPVYQFPQSWGPLEKFADRWVARRLARALPAVQSRGPESTEELRSLGVSNSAIIETPDVVLAMASLTPNLVKRRSAGDGWLGIAPIDYRFARSVGVAERSAYLDRLVALARLQTQQGVRGVRVFAQVEVADSDDDAIIARDLVERLDGESIPVELAAGLEWGEYWRRIGEVDAFVGCRMHSCIFALVSGVPAVGLAYQPKFAALFGQFGRTEWCFDIADFDVKEVSRRLDEIRAGGANLRESVVETADGLGKVVLDGLERMWSRCGCGVLEQEQDHDHHG